MGIIHHDILNLPDQHYNAHLGAAVVINHDVIHDFNLLFMLDKKITKFFVTVSITNMFAKDKVLVLKSLLITADYL